MELILDNCKDRKFVLYLIQFLRDYLTHSVDFKKLKYMEDYINSVPQYKSKFRKHVACRDIILAAAYNLRYRQFGDSYEIFVDNNQKVFGMSAKLCDLCKLINYGSLEVAGTQVFTNTFNYAAENITDLYVKYALSRGDK